MKPQDIIFLIVFAVVVIRQNVNLVVSIGLFFLLSSIPLFAFWIFFTAERFVWYAGAFFLAAIIISLRNRGNW